MPNGALTAESLAGAIAVAERQGRTPDVLAVRDAELEVVAHRILGPGEGLDRLRVVMPKVVVDPECAEAWELR